MHSPRNSALDEIDRHIGQRIRARRRTNGMKQNELAALIRVTPQQMAKYEKGESRVACCRLAQIADALGLPPGDFFPNPNSSASTDELFEIVDRPDILLRALKALTSARRAALVEMIVRWADNRGGGSHP